MQGDWTQAIVMLAAIFGVFLWLRNDIKENRKEIDKLRTEMKGDMQKLRSDMQGDLRRLETKVDGLDSRLRAVESEQSRVAGLLEGLGLAGVLPGDES